MLNLWCFSIHTVICEINGVLWHFAELCVIHCEDLNASVCFLHLTSPRCMELFLEIILQSICNCDQPCTNTWMYRTISRLCNFLLMESEELLQFLISIMYAVMCSVVCGVNWVLVQTLGCTELFPGYVTFISRSLRNYFKFVHIDYRFFYFHYVCSKAQCSLWS